jgi:hypothetical protein
MPDPSESNLPSSAAPKGAVCCAVRCGAVRCGAVRCCAVQSVWPTQPNAGPSLHALVRTRSTHSPRLRTARMIRPRSCRSAAERARRPQGRGDTGPPPAPVGPQGYSRGYSGSEGAQGGGDSRQIGRHQPCDSASHCLYSRMRRSSCCDESSLRRTCAHTRPKGFFSEHSPPLHPSAAAFSRGSGAVLYSPKASVRIPAAAAECRLRCRFALKASGTARRRCSTHIYMCVCVSE